MAKQTFVADTILTAAQMNALQGNDYNQTVSTKIASYTLVAADAGTKIVMNAGATNTTITVNTSLFSAGDTLTILNTSTSGTCTITAGTATVATAGSLALGLNQGGTLYFTSAGVSVFQADGVTASSGALTLTGSADPSAAASTSINNCFSATYQNYLMTYDLVQSTGAVLKLRLRVSGTDSSTGYATSYIYQELAGAATAKVSSGAAGEAYIMQSPGSLTTLGQMFIQRPFEAIATGAQMEHLGEGTPPGYYFSGGWNHSVTTSFDGLTVFPNSGTMTGKIRVYGLALS